MLGLGLVVGLSDFYIFEPSDYRHTIVLSISCCLMFICDLRTWQHGLSLGLTDVVLMHTLLTGFVDSIKVFWLIYWCHSANIYEFVYAMSCVWVAVWQESNRIFLQRWELTLCRSCSVWIGCRDKVWPHVRLHCCAVMSLGSQTGSCVYLENTNLVRGTHWEWYSTVDTKLWLGSLSAALELHLLFLCCAAKQVDKILC